jgi:hypothetical protein
MVHFCTVIYSSATFRVNWGGACCRNMTAIDLSLKFQWVCSSGLIFDMAGVCHDRPVKWVEFVCREIDLIISAYGVSLENV